MGSRGQSAQKARRRAEARAAKEPTETTPNDALDGSPEDLREELRKLRAREEEIRAKLRESEAKKEPTGETVDVFRVFNTEGPESLKQKLQGMDAEGLKRVIRENRLDTFHETRRVNQAEKLADFILERVTAFNTQGDAFRSYKY